MKPERLITCNEVDKLNERNLRELLPYHLAPEYIRLNPYVLHGYRGPLTKKLSLESIFWWTNETINIWSHLLATVYFFGIMVYDLYSRVEFLTWNEKLIYSATLVSFQVVTAFSAMYHTFGCCSFEDYWFFLSFDLFGVAQGLLSIYLTGIYYSFFCYKELQQLYLLTVFAIFAFALLLQIPVFNVPYNIKLAVFIFWVAFGVIPTFHFIVLSGGLEHPMVTTFLPRILTMYSIIGIAFALYVSQVPERFCSGHVDYIGWSHQWWHLLIVIGFIYWQNTILLYLEYRINRGSPANKRLLSPSERRFKIDEDVCAMDKKAWPLSWYELPFYADQDLFSCIIENPIVAYTRLKY